MYWRRNLALYPQLVVVLFPYGVSQAKFHPHMSLEIELLSSCHCRSLHIASSFQYLKFLRLGYYRTGTSATNLTMVYAYFNLVACRRTVVAREAQQVFIVAHGIGCITVHYGFYMGILQCRFLQISVKDVTYLVLIFRYFTFPRI